MRGVLVWTVLAVALAGWWILHLPSDPFGPWDETWQDQPERQEHGGFGLLRGENRR